MANPMFSQKAHDGNEKFVKIPQEAKKHFLSLKKRADAGFADAQYHIGLCYKEGKGIEQSYLLAFHYFKLATDQGYAPAQVFLAILYEEGLGTEQSYSQAIRYYKLAAKQGSASAQVQLGNLYWNGRGVQKSPTQAIEYYLKAAKQENLSAWMCLAKAYEKGIGIEKSEKKAMLYRQKLFQHIKKDADAGNASSQVTVGRLYESGEGVEKSLEQAFYYYKLAAEQNLTSAFYELAKCFAKGKGTENSVENAIHYYELAAHQGDLLAQATLGRYLLKNNKDEEKAVEYLKMVVQKGQYHPTLRAFCEYQLGECFENGKGVKKSDHDALSYYQFAADHGNELAQARLGDIYLQGELGITKSPELAVEYYELASNQGYSLALEMLGKCYESGEGVQQSPEQAFQYYKMAADIDIKKGDDISIFSLARCYKLGIGTEKSLEKAIHYYKFAAENGFADGYSKAAQCYRELGGKENNEKANAYFKMADAAMKGEMEEKILDMKKQHAFSSINFEENKETKIESSFKDVQRGENKPKISCEESQILCLISDYFPEIEKEEIVFLTYLDTDVVGLSGFKKQKGIRLHHLTPWNIHRENIKDIIQDGRLAVIVSSNSKKDRLYLTENAQKNLTKKNVVIVIYPYYSDSKSLEKLFSAEITQSEEPYRCIKTDQIQTFSQNQYACAHKTCLMVFTSQSQLGGSENILLGGMLIHSNNNIKSAELTTINGLNNNNEITSSYFYLSKKGLNRLGVNSRILQLKMISKENIENVENWQKIIEESRLILIVKNSDGKEELLLHHKILEDKPQWKEILIKSLITPLAIEHDDKFVLYQPDVNLNFICQNDYDRIVRKIEPFIHNWFL